MSPADGVRLFVALELPAAVRGALSTWAHQHVGAMERLRLVDVSSLHVTLCFLGSRPATEIDDIAAVCRMAVSGLTAAPLATGPALWLPPRRPRVLTIERADAAGRLATIQSTLAHALAAQGLYTPETRPFLAHVTIARVQREGRPRRTELSAPQPLTFSGDRITLFRSQLGQGPARYEALSSTELQPPFPGSA